MLDPTIAPYLIAGITVCVALLTLIAIPSVIKTVVYLDELTRGGEEIQPDLMRLCWQCNEPVVIVQDGWVCSDCGQHGPPFKEPLPATWEEAINQNTPYRGRR